MSEQYITHCRVLEDAAHPSEPPPPDASIDQKKARVILVAVRKSGRVRVHKARENANGTYSIGKTWNLDDLQQIENHLGFHDKGFTVTLLKPYYWQANSTKEKDFFIQSLVKIYKKYTGGRVPALLGFEGTEIAQLGESVDPGVASASSSIRSAPRETPPPPKDQRDEGNLTMPQIQTPPSQPQTPGGPMNRPLRAQQSTPTIRAGENYMAPPQPSSLRSMQSATNLSPGRLQNQSRNLPQDSANVSSGSNNISAVTSGLNERRRPSDGSTRSANSVTPVVRAETPSSTRQPSIDDQRSIRTLGSIEQPLQPEPVTSKPLQPKMKELPPPIIPPPARSINREVSPQTPTVSTVSDKEKEAKAAKKKSTGDIANRFRLAATTYNAGGLLGKNKSPTVTTPRTPTFGPLSPDGMKGKGASIKDKISGPIIEPPPRSEVRASLSPTDSPSSTGPYPFERSNTDESLKGTAKDPLNIALGNVDAKQDRSLENTFAESPTTQQRKELERSILDDLDTSQLSFQVDQVLKEFHWDWRGKVENLDADIRKELATVEAKNVLINPGGDERLDELSKLFDDAIEQCEALDGLLTLYAVELTSLTDDIAHIENQSQGLQVQTANQKTLQKELERILSTISISPSQLEILKQGSMESGLAGIEAALLALYKAMLTIDPTMTSNSINDVASYDEDNVGSIRALQERKEGYRLETKDFLRRFRQFMNIKFQAEVVGLQKAIREKDVVGQAGRPGIPVKKPQLLGHDEVYKNLYKFAGLILFTKEVDKEEFTELQKLYERPARGLYQEEIRDHIFAWKRISRKITTEESELGKYVLGDITQYSNRDL